MNPAFLDPNFKINMSLDEIIRLTKRHNNHFRGRRFRKVKKSPRNETDLNEPANSFPLGKTNGVDIYVPKDSPLSSIENKRIRDVFTNPALNPNFQQKSRETIPAENNYKLVNTSNRAQRILGSALKKKLSKPRKLKKNPNQENFNNSLPDKPPPLVAALIYKPADETKMDVDNSNNDIIISDFQKQIFDSDLRDEILEAKGLWFSAVRSRPQMRTLNDRFTMLCRNYQF